MSVQINRTSISQAMASLTGVLLTALVMSNCSYADQPFAFTKSNCDSACDSRGGHECVYDWSGPYVGLHSAWSFLDPQSDALNLVQNSSNGFAGGIHGGINRQKGNAVFGVEMDYTLTDLDNVSPCFNPAFNCAASSNWNASVRGRLGFAYDRFLFFGTAGYAFADYHGYTQLVATATKFADDATLTGGTYGGGIEYAVSRNLRLRSEYRFSNFSEETLNYDRGYSVSPNIQSVNFGATVAF